MKKCNCYHKTEYITGWESPYGAITEIRTECWGTPERDYCSCGGDRRKCDFYEDVRKTAIKPKFGEWISVEDKSPEKFIHVLCFYPKKDYGSQVVVDYAETNDGHFAQQFKYGIPTHWMPLPKTPQENDTKD